MATGVKTVTNNVSTAKPGKTTTTSISAKSPAVAVATLSDAALTKYKKELDEMTKQINLWEKALTEAETYLNNSIGSTFKANYAVGAKAGTNIQKIIDILQACKSDLKKLTTAGTEFYKKLQTASKK